MKNFFVLVIILSVLLACSINTGAAFDDGLSVYASAEEQRLVAELLKKERPIFEGILCEDSISPVYSFDILGYRAGDAITLEPIEQGAGFYFAKVSSSEDLPYDGPAHAYIVIKNDHIVSSVIQYPVKDPSFHRVISQSSSYADYSEDIRLALGREQIVPPQNVRMVCCSGIGNCFYISDKEDECFVSLLAIGDNWVDPYRIDLPVTGDCDFVIIRTGDELEAVAKAVLQKKEYVDKNGGSGDGGDGAVFVPEVELTGLKAEHFRDVTDVSSYLGQDYRSASMVFPEAFAPKRPVWPFFAAGGAVVLLGSLTAVAVVIVRKKHAQKCADESPDGSEA